METVAITGCPEKAAVEVEVAMDMSGRESRAQIVDGHQDHP